VAPVSRRAWAGSAAPCAAPPQAAAAAPAPPSAAEQTRPGPLAPPAPQPQRTEPPSPPKPAAKPAPPRKAKAKHRPSPEEVAQAIDARQFDYALQAVVALPQRRPRWYELLSRLRVGSGAPLPPPDWIEAAQSTGRLPVVDRAVLARAVPIVRRVHAGGNDVGLFCNISAETLGDAPAIREILALLDSNQDLKNALLLEVSQDAVKSMGAIEVEALRSVAERGFRLSLDQITDLSLDFAELAAHGFRVVKVPADLMLRGFEEAGAEIHPADLASLLGRYGIELVATDIRTEATVLSLLDYGLKFGQGNLFSPPRPVRAEATGDASRQAAE